MRATFACDQTVGACTGCATDQDCCVVSGVTPCPLTCDPALGHCECQTAAQCRQAFPMDGQLQGCFPP